MAPKIVEVAPEYRDLAEDALKWSSIAVASYLVNQFVLDNPMPFANTVQTALMSVAGLALFHLLVDKFAVRFVVTAGKEGFYQVKKRFD